MSAEPGRKSSKSDTNSLHSRTLTGKTMSSADPYKSRAMLMKRRPSVKSVSLSRDEEVSRGRRSSMISRSSKTSKKSFSNSAIRSKRSSVVIGRFGSNTADFPSRSRRSSLYSTRSMSRARSNSIVKLRRASAVLSQLNTDTLVRSSWTFSDSAKSSSDSNFVSDSSELSDKVGDDMSDLTPRRSVRKSVRKSFRKSVVFDPNSGMNVAMMEVFGKEPCIYNHRIFKGAACILDDIIKSVSLTQTGSPVAKSDYNTEIDPDEEPQQSESLNALRLKNSSAAQFYKSTSDKRLCFQLAIACYKYDIVISSVLDNVMFFTNYPELKEEKPLALVIFFDYLNRKFQPREPLDNETLHDECSNIETALNESTIKLQAAYARYRIKCGALLLENMLPAAYREIDEVVAQMPAWIWVNYLKTDMESVIDELENLGLDEDRNANKDTAPHLDTFYRDANASDVIVINKGNKSMVKKSQMARDKRIIFHDKTQSLVISAFMNKSCHDDIIGIVNPVSLWFAFHVESRMVQRYGRPQPQPSDQIKQVVAFVDKSRHHSRDKELRAIQEAGSVNLQVVSINSLMTAKDERYFPIKSGIFMTSSTMSGIIDPLDYLVTEHYHDQSIINNCLDMSPQRIRPPNIRDHILRNLSYMKAIATLPNLRFLICSTNSIFKEEKQKLSNQLFDGLNKSVKAKPFIWCDIPEPMTLTNNLKCIQNGQVLEMSPSHEGNALYLYIFQRSYFLSPHDVTKKKLSSRSDDNRSDR